MTKVAALTLVVLMAAGVAPAAAQEAPIDPYGPYGPDSPRGALDPVPIDPYGGADRYLGAAPYGGAPDAYPVPRPPDVCSECAELQPPAPPQPVYAPVRPNLELRPRRTSPLVAAGLGLFSTSWALSAIAATGTYRGLLAIPLAGPIIELVHLDRTYEPSFARAFLGGVLVLDALAQTAGVIMAIVGGTRHHRATPRQPELRWSGAGFSGRF